jgi:glutaredoxin
MFHAPKGFSFPDPKKTETMKHEITVMSKKGCHLCENAIRVLKDLKKEFDFEITILDIESDPSLHDEYWLKIPVLRVDGEDMLQAEDIVLPEECERKITNLMRNLR